MKQFINFFIAGLFAYGIRLTVTPFLKEIVGLSLEVSYAISLTIVIIYGFLVNYNIIFKNKENPYTKLCLYLISIAFLSAIDWTVVKFLSLLIPYIVSILISTSIIFILKFIIYKNLIFVDWKIKGGNYFDKHGSRNPIVQYLMNKFYIHILGNVTKHQGKSILEIGCGEGHISNLVKSMTHGNLTSLEYDKDTIEKANQIYPHLNVSQGDIYNLSGSYSLVIASEVLEHIDDYNKAIDNCSNVGKICIFSVPREPWFRLANLCRLSYINRLGNTPGHINNWTKNQFKRLMQEHFNYVTITTSTLWIIAVCHD